MNDLGDSMRNSVAHHGLAIVTVALSCAVAACGANESAKPVTVTSTMPNAGGAASSSPAPTPTGSGSQPADFAEALAIAKQYEAAFYAAQLAGGSTSLPRDLVPITAPPASVDTQQLLAKQKADGWRLAAAPTPVFHYYADHPELKYGATVTVHSCIDSRAVPVLDDPDHRFGKAMEYLYYFKRVQGTLKYFDTDSRPVSACPGH